MKGSLQIKNNKYYAVFRFQGKQKWVGLNIPAVKGNKRKAEDALRRVLTEYTENKNNISDMPFIDYLDMWIKQIRPLVKPSSYESYNKVINGKIKPYFADKNFKLRDLRGMHFTEYFVYLKEHGRSDNKGGLNRKAILNIRGVLSSALTYAVENDMIHSNVVEHSRLPLFEEKAFVPTIYNSDQIKVLLEHAENTKSKMCLFLYLEMFTGARKGELLALTWDNVNFEENTIHICMNRTGNTKEVLNKPTSPKTRNGIRTVSLPEKVMNMLREEKELQKQNKEALKSYYKEYGYDYVIRQADGSIYNPNSVNRIIKKMEAELGLPHCRVHDYRHAVASILFENGVPLADVTTQLGHGQTSTTERIYIHKANVAPKENVQTLSNAIGI